MQINGVVFSDDLFTILTELQTQLALNGIDLLGKMRRSGDNIMVCCPYHAGGTERRPSAGIHVDTGILNCFACHEVHTLQEVISFCFGYTDDMIGAYGWNWLLKNFATLEVEERKDVKLDFVRNSITNNYTLEDNGLVSKNKSDNSVLGVCDTDTDIYVSEEELDSYRYTHPYMFKRGLTDEVIEMFDIGFDKNKQTLTFPVRDISGRCLFIARRSVKTKFFSYPKSTQKSLYGLYEIYKYAKNVKEVIVCESMLDALSFWTVGKVAVALNGTGDAHSYQQLRELPCRELILCTDMDNAGMKAREKIRQNVKNKLICEYFLPKGCKDANDCTKEELLALEKVF